MDQNSWFADLSVGLPPEVERFYRAGDFTAANARIDLLLQQDRLPEQAKGALLACREIMRRIPEDYTLTRADAIALLRQTILLQKQVNAGVGGGKIPGAVIALHLGG